MSSSYFWDIVQFRRQTDAKREAILDFDTGRRYSWEDIANRSCKLANYLTNELSLKKGDCVGFISPTSIAMIDLYFASCLTGVVISAYNYRLKTDELAVLLKNEAPRLLFYAEKYQASVIEAAKRCPTSPRILCIDNSEAHQESDYEATVLRNGSSVENLSPCLSMADPQLLVHTGGTTGIPKAAVLSQNAVFMNAMSEVLSWQLGKDDISYVGMPFYHTGGWNVLSLSVLAAGGRIVLAKEFSARTFLAIAEAEKPTLFMGTDTMYQLIAEHERFAETDLSSYRCLFSGGGPVSEATLPHYWNRGLRLLVGYGMSESGPNNLAPSIATELEQNKKKPLCIGRPMAFTEAAIVDDSDKPVEPGTPGNLLLRGALSFSGYWNDAAATEQAFVDGWVRTGDIGYRDDEGDYYICGRKKNMYISGGENIFPTEIERCLLRCPGVREACVIGVSDEHWGEVGKALIVPEDNTEIAIEIIKDFLEDNISAIKRPRYVELVSSIPKNTLGKRDEKTIRACYGELKASGDSQ